MKRVAILFLLLVLSLGIACSKSVPSTSSPAPKTSSVKVETKSGAPIVLTTSAAEFQVLASGGVQAYLLKNGSRLSLDSESPDPTYLLQGDKKVRFTFDIDHATVSEASGKLGLGKRVDVPGSSSDVPGLQATLHVETY